MGNAAEAEQQARQKEKEKDDQKARDERLEAAEAHVEMRDQQIYNLHQKTDKSEKEMKSKAKEKKHKEKDNNHSVRLTIFVSFLSMLASLALSDTFGWGNTANGTVAILMSLFSMAITFIKLFINKRTRSQISTVGSEQVQTFQTTVDEFNDRVSRESNRSAPSESILKDYHKLVTEKNKLRLEKWRNHLRWIKCVVFFLSSLNDSTFDLFQGIGALSDEHYTDASRKLLLFASWMGVMEEIIESCMEVSPEAFEHSTLSPVIHYVYLLWAAFESAVGIFILLKFDSTGLVTVGIICESLLLFAITATFVYVTVKHIAYHYVNVQQLLIVFGIVGVLCGLFSSLLLMDVFELNQRRTGKIIVIMASIMLLMYCTLLGFGCFITDEFWKMIFVVSAPFNDALFRLIHGIAYILRIKYSVLQDQLLASGTWIGFSVGVFCLGILPFTGECMGDCNIFGMCCIHVILSTTQAIFSIVLISELMEDNDTFRATAISVESLVLVEIVCVVLPYVCLIWSGCVSAHLKDIEPQSNKMDIYGVSINIYIAKPVPKSQDSGGLGGGPLCREM
eukprot:739928_1